MNIIELSRFLEVIFKRDFSGSEEICGEHDVAPETCEAASCPAEETLSRLALEGYFGRQELAEHLGVSLRTIGLTKRIGHRKICSGETSQI
jgi:hypothetical protein